MKERRREKQEERKQDRTCPPGGELKVRKSPTPGKAPSLVGRSAGTKGEPRGLGGEPSNQSVAGKTKLDLHSPVSPSPALRWESTGVHGGWVLECGVWRADLGRGLLLAMRTQPEGIVVWCFSTRNARGGSLEHHRSEAPWLSNSQRVGPPLQALF